MTWKREFRTPSLQGRILLQDTNHHLDKESDSIWLLTEAWVSLLADSPCDPLKPSSLVRKFFRTLQQDPKAVIRSYSSLMDLILMDPSAILSHIALIKKTPIFRECLHFHRTGDHRTFQYIYSFLTFGKKLYFPGNTELETNALRDWLLVEEELVKEVPPQARNLRHVLAGLGRFTPTLILPGHGPGSVSERGIGRDGLLKSLRLTGMDPKVISYLRTLPIGDFGYPTPTGKIPYARTSEAARLKFVPKNYKSMRSICMEPVEKQFLQQAFRLFVENAISESGYSRFIHLDDQALNRKGSEFGSATSLVDTLDLSAASDRLSWELVLSIFPRSWLRFMHVTRSTRVLLPTGDEFRISKFAPMGSSLCFPAQSLVYSAIVLTLYIAEAYGRDWKSDSIEDIPITEDTINWIMSPRFTSGDPTNRFQPFLTYGDDIILDRRISQGAIEALELFGFKVNVEKSFRGDHPFRESCGAHHLNGCDVTPFQHKVKHFHRGFDPSSFVSVVEHANNALQYGYLHLRSVYIRHALHFRLNGKCGRIKDSLGVNPVFFSQYGEESSTVAIQSFFPRNEHLRAQKRGFRFSRELQRSEWKALTVSASEEPSVITTDNIRHIGYWRPRQYNEGLGPNRTYIKLPRPDEARFRMRYVAS